MANLNENEIAGIADARYDYNLNINNSGGSGEGKPGTYRGAYAAEWNRLSSERQQRLVAFANKISGRA